MTIHMNLGQDSYDILVERGILARAKDYLNLNRRVLVVTDTQVPAIYAQTLAAQCQSAVICTVETGENSKSLGGFGHLLQTMLDHGFSRKDCVVAVGGGVVGDLSGFAASAYMRGIDFYNIPTTLLSMVDSSVGGKTAVDLKNGKNLAGAFCQPSLVLIDPDTLNTLSPLIFSDGMAEVIKYGMINTPSLLTSLQGDYDINDVIEICVSAKRDIVAVDERDTGIRQLLNFGHTPAHGIELLSQYTISHGSAVAIGMVIMTKAAIKRGMCEEKALTVLLGLLDKFSLPSSLVFSAEEIAEAALGDKKRSGDSITLVIPGKEGSCRLEKMPVSELQSFFSEAYSK